MLISARVLRDRVGVHSRLVSECAVPDKRQAVVGDEVRDIIEVARQLGELPQGALWHAVQAHFESRLIGIIVHILALPQRSPRPLIVPCTCVAPAWTAAMESATAIPESLCA